MSPSKSPNGDAWRLVENLFHAALEQAESKRAAWLASQTSDPVIRCEVESLLRNWQRNLTLPAEDDNRPETPLDSAPAERFGPYEAVKLIGRGGMGAVYLARRVDGQFNQSAAIKVIAAHLAGAEFVERFRTEEQLLAALNHPNITRLLDAGVLASGAPYFVMEYVEGEPLDRYCDLRRLAVEARLRLFLQICDAVDYAHRNLIVHRDLKEGNILVTAEGQVKLLDFGTAALYLQSSAVTATRNRMLTPRYASPERLRGERASTGNDVFSLGVILYELLTGAWPYGDPDSMINELKRAMGDIVPIAPSTAVNDEAAARRGLTRERLQRVLEGDLSAIVLKALEHDPARRFDSVRQMAEDIERFLNGRPVHARAQTAWYRTRKFVRRNWRAITAAAVFVSGLVAATGVAIYQANHARTQAARAQRLADFTNNVFLPPDGDWRHAQSGQGKDTKLMDVLESASRRLTAELKADPLTEMTLRTTLARTFLSMAMYQRAEQEAELAWKLLPFVAGQAPKIEAELAVCRCDIPFLQHRYAPAQPRCRDALNFVRRLKEVPNPLMIPAAGHLLVTLPNEKRGEAESLFREAMAANPHPQGSTRTGVLNLQCNFAVAKANWGDIQGAIADYRRILAEPDSANSRDTFMLHNNLAVWYDFIGDLPASEAEYRESLRTMTPTAAVTFAGLQTRIDYGSLLAREGKVREAESRLAEVQPLIGQISPIATRLTLEAMFESATGVCELKAGHPAESERRILHAMEVYRRAGTTETPRPLRWLAEALAAQGRIAEARAAVDEAVRIWTRTRGAGFPLAQEAKAWEETLAR